MFKQREKDSKENPSNNENGRCTYNEICVLNKLLVMHTGKNLND